MSETPYGELVARDPLSLSRADIDQIIAHLRANRKKFLMGGAAPAPAKKIAKPSTPIAGDVSDLLGDLDL